MKPATATARRQRRAAQSHARRGTTPLLTLDPRRARRSADDDDDLQLDDDEGLHPDEGADTSGALRVGRAADRAEQIRQRLVEELETHFSERDATLAERLSQELEGALEELRTEFRSYLPAADVPGLPKLATDPTLREGEDAFSYARATLAIYRRDWDLAPLEHEVFRETHKRQNKDLTSGTPTAGGYIVPEQYTGSLVEYLYNNVVAFALGATRFNAGRGMPIKIPRLDASATAEWIATELTTITKSSQTLGQVELTPHTLAARTVLSNLLIENSLPVADQLVEQDLRTRLTVGMDLGILSGSGGAGQPTGIVNTAGVNTHDFTKPAADHDILYSDLVAMRHELAKDNALQGRLAWAFNPQVVADLMLAGTENPGSTDEGKILEVGRRIFSDSPDDRVLGYPYAESNQLPATGKSLILGNWPECLVPVWKGLELRATDVGGGTFEADGFMVRGIMRADVGVRHPVSFCVGINYGASS